MKFVRAAIRRVGLVGHFFNTWGDPLHIARRVLRRTMVERAHHARGRLLDVGCGSTPYRSVFANVTKYIGVDLPGTGSPTVFGDALRLPFLAGQFDTVLCNEVLEHVPDTGALIGESVRVLRPGGILILTTPQTWGLHHEPHDYYRFTKYGLRYVAEKAGLTVIEVAPTCGLWATLAQRLADTVVYTYLVRRSRVWVTAASVALAPVLIIGYATDQLFGRRGDTLDNVLVARKP